ncbi:MAG: PhnD/SsuA/transferrin family substrate-binding protein, partial [Rhodocyclaceae bacterium]|nr:PhnD/SsuA/transferrin family substrate-binding protein [Rhodocyclaceae bacterium]
FRQAGMQPERDYRIQIVKSPSNAVHAVLQGEVEAGITTANLIPQLTDDMKQRLRVLSESREIPGLMFMLLPAAHTRHPQLQDILLQFEHSEAGQKFVEALAVDGFRIPGSEEMKGLDNFLPEYRKHFRR